MISPLSQKNEHSLGGAHSGQHPRHHLHHPHPWQTLMQMMQMMQVMRGMLENDGKLWEMQNGEKKGCKIDGTRVETGRKSHGKCVAIGLNRWNERRMANGLPKHAKFASREMGGEQMDGAWMVEHR